MLAERVDQLIFVVRGQRVILDSDLARLYGVTTARLNEQVKRNLDRFPLDFMWKRLLFLVLKFSLAPICYRNTNCRSTSCRNLFNCSAHHES